MNQLETPLYNVLKKHHQIKPISLHVPGHKYGVVNPEEEDRFFQELYKIDATELTELDDLHSPEGAILKAERLLADAYNAKTSYFLVNGSTIGNLAMIMGTIKELDTVFVQRNCHKSILNGIELAKGKPVFLGPEFYDEWKVAGGVSLETVKEAYQLFPNCKAIILTYPNYYGAVTTDLEQIIHFAHERHIPVLIDEAHGAHFLGGDYFPPSSVDFGADVVVQSAHKTLPALTMGSFLHIKGPYVSRDNINHYLRILQSSSPSYPIMASLDLARRYIATYSKEDQEYLKEQISLFRAQLQRIKGIKLLEYPNKSGDPLKITVQSTTNISGYDLQHLFEEKGIFTELADPFNVLFILPLLKRGMRFPFDDILKRISKALDSLNLRASDRNRQQFTYFKKSKITTLHLNRNQIFKEKLMPIEQAVNFICGEAIIPYPPGIPLLLRGEKITDEDTNTLRLLLKTGARFQGGKKLTEGQITVLIENLEDENE